jgi:hypothetical protein
VCRATRRRARRARLSADRARAGRACGALKLIYKLHGSSSRGRPVA